MKRFLILIPFVLIFSFSCAKKITEQDVRKYIYSKYSNYSKEDIKIEKIDNFYFVYTTEKLKLDLYKVSDKIELVNTFEFDDGLFNKILNISLSNIAENENPELIIELWNDGGQSYSRIDVIVFSDITNKNAKKVFEITKEEFSSGVNENDELESDIIHQLEIEFKNNSIIASGIYNREKNQKLTFIWSDKENKFIKTK
ncbi:MAG: hypothetical protein ACP5Q5_08325 [Brevinematia bacterium]